MNEWVWKENEKVRVRVHEEGGGSEDKNERVNKEMRKKCDNAIASEDEMEYDKQRDMWRETRERISKKWKVRTHEEHT